MILRMFLTLLVSRFRCTTTGTAFGPNMGPLEQEDVVPPLPTFDQNVLCAIGHSIVDQACFIGSEVCPTLVVQANLPKGPQFHCSKGRGGQLC
jgi:hypothetical protein